MKRALLGALVVLTWACDDSESGGDGDGDVSISLVDHSDALSDATGDNLFEMTLDEGGPFSLAEIELTGQIPGQTGVILRFDHVDDNGDGALDDGEVLIGREPPANIFDATTVGVDVEVDLNRDDGQVLRRLVGAIWTPVN